MDSYPPYHVFLSHPGEYKHTIAIPLYKILTQRGITVFLDEPELKLGNVAPEKMEHCMETAPIGVFLLGPEFLAKVWTMKELYCFQRRVDQAKARGDNPPLLIPVFYGMDVAQCSSPSIFGYVNENGEAVFSKWGFIDRVMKGNTSFDQVLQAVRSLSKNTGIRNDECATNEATVEMEQKRGALVMRIADEVEKTVKEAVFPVASKDVEADQGSDRFVPVENMVPNNPFGIVLDFDSKREDGTPLTSEGQLLDDVFDTSPLSYVIAVAQGEGGVGKTCALRAIGRRPDVRKRFEGGVLYVTVGEGANELTLIDRLALMVENAGGKIKAQSIRRANLLGDAVSIAKTWFQGPTLFLIDDIWAMNGISLGTVHTLSNLACNERSRVVFTSRDTKLKTGGKCVIFKSKTDFSDPQCEKILCAHARLPVPTSPSLKEYFGKVLRSCAGLPLALAVAGGTIFQLSTGLSHNELEKAWLAYLKLWNRESAGGMVDRLLISLKVLEPDGGESLYRRRFEALSVLQKAQYVPIDVLRRLWGTSLAEATDVVFTLERVSVIRSIDTGGKDDYIKAVGLHDVLLDISRKLSLKRETQHEHAKKLIWSYHPVLSSGTTLLDQPFRLWWGSGKDDGYFFENVCWLLKRAGRGVDIDMMHLLTSAKWIVRQLTKCGEAQIVREMELAEECVLSSEWPSWGTGDGSSWLRLLRRAVRLSKNEVLSSTWAGMAWFQLYGRLVYSMDNVCHVRVFVKEIEDEAPKPWLKGGEGCLLAAGGSLRDVVEFKGRFICFRPRHDKISILHQNGRRVVISEYDRKNGTTDQVTLNEICDDIGSACFSRDGKAVVLGFYDGRIMICTDQKHGKEHKIVAQGVEQNNEISSIIMDGDVGSGRNSCETPMLWSKTVVTGHSGSVTCVGMSDDSSVVVCGCDDNSVCLWAKEGETWVLSVLKGHRDKVKSVGMSGEGSRIVSGSRDCTVRVWRKENGTWVGSDLIGHENWVYSVWMSNDGRRVVSGYYDGTVRVWEREGEEYVGCVLKGFKRSVFSVWIGNDGRQVIAGSSDLAVRVWEKKGKGWISSALEGHTGKVMSVWLSEDGRVAVSGGNDCTVRVWEKEGEKWGGPVLAGHNGEVTSMVVSDDGMRVVSGSADKTVRVWEREGEKWVASVMEGHTNGITSVAISSEGGRIVSGSDDTTVRVWEREGEKWHRFVLNGHNEAVFSVFISGDGRRIVSASADRTVRVWEREGENWVGNVLKGHENGVISVGMSLDGRRIVSGSADNSVRVWDRDEELQVGSLSRNSGVWRRKRNTVWSASVLRGHTGGVESVGLSDDGGRVVSSSWDGTVRVWHVADGGWCCVFTVDVEWFGMVEISGDGHTIIGKSLRGRRGITFKYEGEEWVEQKRGDHILDGDDGWTDQTRVSKAVDAIEVQKTFCGYVMTVKRSPFIVFLDWVH